MPQHAPLPGGATCSLHLFCAFQSAIPSSSSTPPPRETTSHVFCGAFGHFAGRVFLLLPARPPPPLGANNSRILQCVWQFCKAAVPPSTPPSRDQTPTCFVMLLKTFARRNGPAGLGIRQQGFVFVRNCARRLFLLHSARPPPATNTTCFATCLKTSARHKGPPGVEIYKKGSF